MKHENTFILELCKFIKPDRARLEALMEHTLDYPYILGQILYHRMGAAAYETLRKCELLGRVNREFRNTLKAIYDVGTDKTNSLLCAMQSLKAVLKEADFPYALLKGAYLVQLYPLGLRTSNDIDILIEPQSITDLTARLKAAGFAQGNIRNGSFQPATRAEIVSSRLNRGETIPFIKRVNLPKMEYLELDINFSLDFKASGNTDIVSALLANTQKTISNGYYTLSQADFLIHLCVHLFKEATVMAWVEMGRDLSLYKFCDIYLFVDRFLDGGFCRELIQSIRRYGLERECYYAFFNTRKLFEIQNEEFDRLIEAIRPADLRYMNEILDPVQNRRYAYDMDYIDWMFCYNRKEQLHEI